jgi:hypothetical protein
LGIPASWDEVSPGWMTTALAGSCPGAEVSRVDVLLRDDGTNRRARLGLAYRRGQGPSTVFVKAADPAHAKLNARTGGVFNEPRLFHSGVPLPLDHPQVHLALIDEANLDFLIVMEDVGRRGGDPRDATRPLTVDQAVSGVRGLARLHGHYWGERLSSHPTLDWVEPFVAWKVMAAGIDIGLRRAGETIPPAVARLSGDDIEGHYWARYIDTFAEGPTTLLHGDPHIGNTYVLPGDEVGFLDWQVVRRGDPALDLGYFLQGALTIEDRRASEADLVEEYRSALDLPDHERPTREGMWLRYRASVAHGLAIWLATAASDTWQRPEVSLALAQRYATAFVDLDCAAAIDELRA